MVYKILWFRKATECLDATNFIVLKALFASLIIRTFQLLFSAGTEFFSHNKSARTVFWLVFSAKRTGPKPWFVKTVVFLKFPLITSFF